VEDNIKENLNSGLIIKKILLNVILVNAIKILYKNDKYDEDFKNDLCNS